MKKKRIELFPEMDSFKFLADEEHQLQLKAFSPGKFYRIGKPSAVHYNFVKPSIVPNEMKMEVSNDFNDIEGLIVRVVSILQMVSGKRIAVLRHHNDELFLEKHEKVFAEVYMSIINKEIVPLDLETRRILESDSKLKS